MHAEQQTATKRNGNHANQHANDNSQLDRPLNNQQRAFAIELAKGVGRTDAYITAFAHKGKRIYAANSALKLSRDPRIADFIAALGKRAIDLGAISKDDIELALAEIAFSDIRQLFDETGEILPPHEWPDSIARCIAGYEESVAPGGLILKRKVRLWDKPGALKMMAEIKAMLHGKPDSTQRAHFTFDLSGMAPKGKAEKRVKGRIIESVAQDGAGSTLEVGLSLPPRPVQQRCSTGAIVDGTRLQDGAQPAGTVLEGPVEPALDGPK